MRPKNPTDKSPIKADKSPVKADKPLTKFDTSLTKFDTSLTKSDTPLTKSDKPLTRGEKPLTKAEEQVMQVLWKLEKGFLKEVLEATTKPRPHPNTIATLLKILVEKGYVAYEVQGRNNLYKPLISKAEYGEKSVNQLIRGYFGGSPARLVSQFVNDNKLSLQELEELLQQIKSAKNAQP